MTTKVWFRFRDSKSSTWVNEFTEMDEWEGFSVDDIVWVNKKGSQWDLFGGMQYGAYVEDIMVIGSSVLVFVNMVKTNRVFIEEYNVEETS